jgi:hypothetical protein
MRAVGLLFRPFAPAGLAHLLAGIGVGNLAFVAALTLLYRLSAGFGGPAVAARSVVYLALFPTGFFLLAAYTESLFLLLALAAIWFAEHDRPWLAGCCGFLAALTRLTGWSLAIPLAYAYARRHGFRPRLDAALLAAGLPLLGLALFLAWRAATGLPPLPEVYRQYWHQATSWPGLDLFRALGQLFAGRACFTLLFDLFCLGFLLATTALSFRDLGPTYGLYGAMMLLFMLLPASELKPLYSFSRYTLAFFPAFILLARAGANPWANRLVVYPSLALYLYFSGQFFLWGWVA